MGVDTGPKFYRKLGTLPMETGEYQTSPRDTIMGPTDNDLLNPILECPLGPDSPSFYEIAKYSELNNSLAFLKEYYELNLQLEPLVVRENGTSYLLGMYHNNSTGVKFENLGGFYMPEYKESQFDCSQQAALMEYYLERNGIRAKIALSNNFTLGGKNGKHAWVEVVNSSGACYVDVTIFKPKNGKLRLITPEDSDYVAYSSPEHLYSNIYELIGASLANPRNENNSKFYREFAWWNSPWFVR